MYTVVVSYTEEYEPEQVREYDEYKSFTTLEEAKDYAFEVATKGSDFCKFVEIVSVEDAKGNDICGYYAYSNEDPYEAIFGSIDED